MGVTFYKPSGDNDKQNVYLHLSIFVSKFVHVLLKGLYTPPGVMLISYYKQCQNQTSNITSVHPDV